MSFQGPFIHHLECNFLKSQYYSTSAPQKDLPTTPSPKPTLVPLVNWHPSIYFMPYVTFYHQQLISPYP